MSPESGQRVTEIQVKGAVTWIQTDASVCLRDHLVESLCQVERFRSQMEAEHRQWVALNGTLGFGNPFVNSLEAAEQIRVEAPGQRIPGV